MKKIQRVVAGALATSLLCIPARVGAGTLTGGATEWTQIANNAQLMIHTIQMIRQVYNLVQQVKYMAQHSENLDFLGVLGVIDQTGDLLMQMQGIMFAGKSLAERWQAQHPGAVDMYSHGYGSTTEAYNAIDESTRQAVGRALKVLDVQVTSKDGFAKDNQILKDLAAKAQSANGQLKATQVTNLLLLEMLRQLQLLRSVHIAQAEMEGYYYTGETQRRQYERGMVHERITGEAPPRGPSFATPGAVVDIVRSGTQATRETYDLAETIRSDRQAAHPESSSRPLQSPQTAPSAPTPSRSRNPWLPSPPPIPTAPTAAPVRATVGSTRDSRGSAGTPRGEASAETRPDGTTMSETGSVRVTPSGETSTRERSR